MKALKLVAILAMVFMSFSARAVCPTQPTTIFFINGVDNTWDDADLSRGELATAIKSRGVSSDCVTVKLAYNKSENRTADLAEASRQKTLEAGLTATNFWEMWERLIPSQNWFVEQFRTAMSTEQVLYDARDPKILAQINEHIEGPVGPIEPGEFAGYRNEPAENQLLFVAHSQGNFFGNEERLGMLERYPQIGARVKMVSVATPSSNVAGDIKPYTTLTEDKLMANVIGALVPNLTNGTTGGECSALLILLGKVDEYICHGFIESYMVPDSKSRKKIIDDVIAALPAAYPELIPLTTLIISPDGTINYSALPNPSANHIFVPAPSYASYETPAWVASNWGVGSWFWQVSGFHYYFDYPWTGTPTTNMNSLPGVAGCATMNYYYGADLPFYVFFATDLVAPMGSPYPSFVISLHCSSDGVSWVQDGVLQT